MRGGWDLPVKSECEERVGKVCEGNIFLDFTEEIEEGRGGESL